MHLKSNLTQRYVMFVQPYVVYCSDCKVVDGTQSFGKKFDKQ